MLITTALHHNEYAFKGIVAVPEAVAVIKSTEEQEPLKSSDMAAQSADVAGTNLAPCWLWTMWLPNSNGHDALMKLAWSCSVGLMLCMLTEVCCKLLCWAVQQVSND